ncbi:MAG TPA: class F sortase [Actinophytocola sp.]|uniref:class F sortase n=1 Tax=Actinophytocola sp. TaxID=1872138 RepID=UPI002DDDA40A|nr:class F sortase [Actinophytocola sp.]HEV2783099.1 class F sortase [Actinophytocola sp.]
MRRASPAVLAAVLGAVLLAGCGAATGGPQPATGPPTASARAGVEPAEIGIPRLGVTSSLVGLGLNADQTVQVPPVDQPMQAGWFTGGPPPGATGPAVILGHVNGGGHPGVFARLHELTAGDEVLVRRVDGTTVRFVVREVDQVPKAKFPTDAVYGDTTGPELRLITCGGAFDRTARSYRDNVIVYAAV